MKSVKRLIIQILMASAMFGCSPFGTQNLIEEISTNISNIFDGKTSPSLISGSTSFDSVTIPTTGVTSPDGIPVSSTGTYVGTGPSYKVTQTIGEPYQYSMDNTGGVSTAPTMKTAVDSLTKVDTGYKVYSTISTNK